MELDKKQAEIKRSKEFEQPHDSKKSLKDYRQSSNNRLLLLKKESGFSVKQELKDNIKIRKFIMSFLYNTEKTSVN